MPGGPLLEQVCSVASLGVQGIVLVHVQGHALSSGSMFIILVRVIVLSVQSNAYTEAGFSLGTMR